MAGLNIEYKWKAFIAVGLSLVTMVMSMSISAVALPSIAADLGISLKMVSWVVIANSLTVTAILLPLGRLSDLIGRKFFLCGGLIIFFAGGLMCGFSNSIGFLVASRVIMGVGGAMGQAVGTAIVVSVFPSSERGKGIASQTTAVAVGGALGPVFGGLILEFFDWQTLSFFISTLSIFSFSLGFYILDDSKIGSFQSKDRVYDWAGAIFSGLAMLALVISINNPFEFHLYGFTPFGLMIALLFLILFVVFELRTNSPIMNLKLFKDPVFRYASITRIVGFMGRSSLFILLPTYLMNIKNISPGSVGLIMLFSAVGMAVGAQSGGRLSDRYGHWRFTVLGFVLAIVTCMFIALFDANTSLVYILIILLFNGFSMGFWATPNQVATMSSVPRESFGTIGAFVNLTRNIGNVVGQALVISVISLIMVSEGFNVQLSEVGEVSGSTESFVFGWKIAYIAVIAITIIGLISAILTKSQNYENREIYEDTKKNS